MSAASKEELLAGFNPRGREGRDVMVFNTTSDQQYLQPGQCFHGCSLCLLEPGNHGQIRFAAFSATRTALRTSRCAVSQSRLEIERK